MKPLYQLADEYKSLLDNLYDEETGVVNLDNLEKLNALNKPLQDKCINVVRKMKSFEAEYKAIEAERKAMQAREKALKSQIDWLKEYLLSGMEQSAINEISCPQFVIKIAKNPPSVEIENEEFIPEEYFQTVRMVSKDAIKLAISGGMEVPGARLIQRNSIRIK